MTQDTGRDHHPKNPALLHCIASVFQTVPSHTVSGVYFHFCLMKLWLLKTALCLLTEFFPLRRQKPRKSPFCRWHLLLVRITESSEAFLSRAHSALWFYHFTSLCSTGILGNDSSKSKRLIYKPTCQFIHLYQGN